MIPIGDIHRYTSYGQIDGEWTYDPQTKIFTLVGLENAQWQITGIGSTALSALALWTNGNSAYTGQKRGVGENILFNRIKWSCGADALDIKSYEFKFPYTISYKVRDEGGPNAYGLKYEDVVVSFSSSDFHYDEAKDIIWADHKETSKNSYYKNNGLTNDVIARVELIHPYSYGQMYMDIKVDYHGKTLSGIFFPSWRTQPESNKLTVDGMEKKSK